VRDGPAIIAEGNESARGEMSSSISRLHWGGVERDVEEGLHVRAFPEPRSKPSSADGAPAPGGRRFVEPPPPGCGPGRFKPLLPILPDATSLARGRASRPGVPPPPRAIFLPPPNRTLVGCRIDSTSDSCSPGSLRRGRGRDGTMPRSERTSSCPAVDEQRPHPDESEWGDEVASVADRGPHERVIRK